MPSHVLGRSLARRVVERSPFLPEPCFKYGCNGTIVTYEQPEDETFASGVCDAHALRPDLVGTPDDPIRVELGK